MNHWGNWFVRMLIGRLLRKWLHIMVCNLWHDNQSGHCDPHDSPLCFMMAWV